MSNKHDETKTNPREDEKNRDEATQEKAARGEATVANLEGGEDAKDALGVKKNMVGENRDKQGPDNSPTTNDVSQDLDQVISDARDEGFRNGQAEAEEAGREVPVHPEGR